MTRRWVHQVGGCSICGKPCASRNLCGTHYSQWYRTGDPLGTTRKTVEENFHTKYQKNSETGCWDWTGMLQTGGYGVLSAGKAGKRVYAHRFSHEIYKGPIPEGYDIDHLCRNRKCVNPDHLEAVTRFENLYRGDTIVSKKMKRTECPKGHPLTPDNLYIRKRKNGRKKTLCRACVLFKAKKYRAKKKEVILDGVT